MDELQRRRQEALNSFEALGISAISIEPALAARNFVFERPNTRLQIVNGPTDAGWVVYEGPQAPQVRDEIERYFARHFPGRTDLHASIDDATTVRVICT